MKSEEINIAIAEYRGWKRKYQDHTGGVLKDHGNILFWMPPESWYGTSHQKTYSNDRESPILRPPDYYHNLNDINEAYTTLSENEKTMFNLQLWKLLDLPESTMLEWGGSNGYCMDMGYTDDAVNALMGATAPQLAEAFVKTIEKLKK